MKLYLAAGFSKKNDIAEKTELLKSYGVDVVSSWHLETVGPQTTLADCSDDYHRENAARDLAEIESADTLVLFTQDPTIPFCRGGRMHEAGYAQGKGKRVVVVGPKENIFHWLSDVTVYASFSEFFDAEVVNG